MCMCLISICLGVFRRLWFWERCLRHLYWENCIALNRGILFYLKDIVLGPLHGLDKGWVTSENKD